MQNYLWIALGGALGSMARFWAAGVVARQLGETFPWGTLLVNVSGCFVLGFFAALTAPDGRWLASPAFRLFFATGVCGGYTTFSAFGLQTFALGRAGEWLPAGANALLSLTLCLAAIWLGQALAGGLSPSKGS